MPRFGEMKPIIKFWQTLSCQPNNSAWLIKADLGHLHIDGIVSIDRDRNGIATRYETVKAIYVREA